VTNDFPPRAGGIQSFVHGLVDRQPADSVVVYAPSWDGAAAFDAASPFPIVRHRTSLMIAEPTVARRAREIARAECCDSVLFGAAAPLGLLANGLRRSGVERFVALTHGHEAAWAQLPGARELLRRIGAQNDVVTYLGEYTRSRIASALDDDAAAAMVRLTPGVDEIAFSPDTDGAPVREQYGLTGRPVVVCVSRLMTRKGQDTLIEAWPAVRRQVPGAALLIVGEGPYRGHLERLVRDHGLENDVVLTGGVPWAELPAHYAAGDVFAMPCRTRRRGLDVEGLGIVYLEAAATGLPVVAGDSGGAPDAVRDGETGYVVPGGSVPAVAARVVELLRDPETARAMGARGRAWVEQTWTWRRQADLLSELLAPR
jgi:phosphatidyl-myo-inositol dimannoside synthase